MLRVIASTPPKILTERFKLPVRESRLFWLMNYSTFSLFFSFLFFFKFFYLDCNFHGQPILMVGCLDINQIFRFEPGFKDDGWITPSDL